jgi:hypothetical protein
MCKEYGGLGIPNLRDLNISLLASWLRRYKSDKDKLWKELIDFKYGTENPNIFVANSSGGSSFFQRVHVGSTSCQDGVQMESWEW